MNVLIVEDDPMVGRLNAGYLGEINGARLVGRCRDVLSALAMLHTDPVDLVLLDVYLGRRSGLEIAEWLSANRPDTEIILVTAASELATVRSARRLGVADYLVKPFTKDRFVEAVEAARRRRRALTGPDGPIAQQTLDTLFRGVGRANLRPDGLPKGLTPQTLAEIAAAVATIADRSFGVEDLAESVAISRVSIRKYLRHLVERGILSEEYAYGTVGRPAFAYRCIDPAALQDFAGRPAP